MRAIRQHEFGGSETLRLEAPPDLTPGPGQVRIEVLAAGVHLVDTTIRQGIEGGPFPVPTLPMTPGREVAGLVDAVGDGVDDSWLEVAVAANLGEASGGYASQAVAPVDALIPLPPDVWMADAIAMLGTGRTALAVLDEAQLTADDVVVVTAAAGGIGSLLVQAAHVVGATVVALAGGATKVATARSLGAEIGVDYLRDGWVDRVHTALGDRRATVALDGVGGAIGRGAFELLAPGGRMVFFGYSSGELIPLDAGDLFARGVAVTSAIGPRMFARPGGIKGLAEDAINRLSKGEWRALTTTFPLADAARAHDALVGRATTGKVVLLP